MSSKFRYAIQLYHCYSLQQEYKVASQYVTLNRFYTEKTTYRKKRSFSVYPSIHERLSIIPNTKPVFYVQNTQQISAPITYRHSNELKIIDNKLII